MAATEAAVDRGYGPGMVVDTDLIDAELVVEDVEGGGTDAGFGGSNGTTLDADEKQADSYGGEVSVFDIHADRWYRPDSETYDWAVRTTNGERRYFKTREGARNRLQTEYE